MDDPLMEPIIEIAVAGFYSPVAPDPAPPEQTAADPGGEPRGAGPGGLIPGAAIGRLVGWTTAGEPLVDVSSPGAAGQAAARATVALGAHDRGRDVVLVFERGDPLKPIILGVLESPSRQDPETSRVPPAEASVDGERLVLTARKEVVLRCGEASITLTRAGKILIRGAYVLSRSAGANQIKGASVQIN
jgi:hypothetical protein